MLVPVCLKYPHKVADMANKELILHLLWIYIKAYCTLYYKGQISGSISKSFMAKTIKKGAQRGNYLFYSQTMLIDLIKGSRPFWES